MKERPCAHHVWRVLMLLPIPLQNLISMGSPIQLGPRGASAAAGSTVTVAPSLTPMSEPNR